MTQPYLNLMFPCNNFLIISDTILNNYVKTTHRINNLVSISYAHNHSMRDTEFCAHKLFSYFGG